MEGAEPIFQTGGVDAAQDSSRARPGAAGPVSVTHFTRGLMEGGFSVERIFEDVRQSLPADINVKVVHSSRPNTGVLPRVMNALTARRKRDEINHVLGDTQYLAWFLPRARTVLTVLDCVSLERHSGLRRWLLRLLWYWWPLTRAAHVTTLSEFSKKSLLHWVRYPEREITVVPPPLSPEFTHSPAKPHKSWSRLLHIGMAHHKNLARVIDAIAGLDVTLVTIGQLAPEMERALRARGIRYENYHRLSRERLLEEYRKSDLLVFPSTYEGWGMPIIEAQAIGRPVVTANVASMPEAAGGAACLVDPFDVASIRSGICRILNDEAYARGLIDAGIDNASNYSAAKIAGQYADIYRSLAARNRAVD